MASAETRSRGASRLVGAASPHRIALALRRRASGLVLGARFVVFVALASATLAGCPEPLSSRFDDPRARYSADLEVQVFRGYEQAPGVTLRIDDLVQISDAAGSATFASAPSLFDLQVLDPESPPLAYAGLSSRWISIQLPTSRRPRAWEADVNVDFDPPPREESVVELHSTDPKVVRATRTGRATFRVTFRGDFAYNTALYAFVRDERGAPAAWGRMPVELIAGGKVPVRIPLSPVARWHRVSTTVQALPGYTLERQRLLVDFGFDEEAVVLADSERAGIDTVVPELPYARYRLESTATDERGAKVFSGIVYFAPFSGVVPIAFGGAPELEAPDEAAPLGPADALRWTGPVVAHELTVEREDGTVVGRIVTSATTLTVAELVRLGLALDDRTLYVARVRSWPTAVRPDLLATFGVRTTAPWAESAPVRFRVAAP